MATGLSRLLTVPHRGFALRFYDSSISLQLWLHPPRVPGALEQLFRRYLREGDTVVDVGANIGLYTMIASVAVGAGGHVHAIEPDPRIAGYLRGNLRLNRTANVTTHNVALGARAGSLRFSDQGQDDRNCVVEHGPGRDVPVVRLDALPIGAPDIALLKIDVEGYEAFVLDGATALLPRVACVVLETWERHFASYGYSCPDVHARLQAHGFRLFRLAGDAWVEVEPGYVSTSCEDLVGVRDADAFEARTGLTLCRHHQAPSFTR